MASYRSSATKLQGIMTLSRQGRGSTVDGISLRDG